MQHRYCGDIDWKEAQPGDLVFYLNDTHVGIVRGVDENGDILVIHGSSNADCVVISDTVGFAEIGRPQFFWGEK